MLLAPSPTNVNFILRTNSAASGIGGPTWCIGSKKIKSVSVELKLCKVNLNSANVPKKVWHLPFWETISRCLPWRRVCLAQRIFQNANTTHPASTSCALPMMTLFPHREAIARSSWQGPSSRPLDPKHVEWYIRRWPSCLGLVSEIPSFSQFSPSNNARPSSSCPGGQRT